MQTGKNSNCINKRAN